MNISTELYNSFTKKTGCQLSAKTDLANTDSTILTFTLWKGQPFFNRSKD
jgi:hypothetical protein